MKISLGIANFLEEISCLSHSIVFFYFFALMTEEGFLISSCYSLELCIQMGISFLSPLLFTSLLFTAICKASSDDHFAFLHFFFLGMVLIPASRTMSQTSVHSSSGTLSIRSSPLTTLQVDISSFYGLRVFKTLTNTQLVSGKAGIQSQTCADAKNSCSLPVSLQQIAELSAKFSLQSR